jgi:phosphate transport system permease protein
MMSLEVQAKRAAMFAKRKRINTLATSLALGAMGFGLFWLAWILVETIRLGIGGLNLATLTQMTPGPNEMVVWPTPYTALC